jgi:membrane protein
MRVATIGQGNRMRIQRIWHLITRSVSAWMDDYAPSMGAAIAYYTLFSIAPLLVIVIAISGVVFGAEAAQNAIVAQLEGLIGHEGAVAIQGLIRSASEPGRGATAAIVGAVTLFIGATSVFAELQSALDRIWEVPAGKKASGIWQLIRQRLLSFGMILVLGLLMLVSLVVSAALAAFGRWWGAFFGDWETMLHAVNLFVSFAVVTGLFAAIYKIMPRAEIAWRDVWIGAVVTALLFTIGKFLIGLYLGKSGVTSGFGAAGSMVVLLVWVYYSAQIFLLGAEFTWVYAHASGSRVTNGRRGTDPRAADGGTGGSALPRPRASRNAASDPQFASSRPGSRR